MTKWTKGVAAVASLATVVTVLPVANVSAASAGSGNLTFKGVITMDAGAYTPSPPPPKGQKGFGIQYVATKVLAKEFEKLHPGITIQFVTSPPGQSVTPWLLAKADGGQAPDITPQNVLSLSSYPSGIFTNLKPYLQQPDPYLGGKKWSTEFQPNITAQYISPDGGQYVINGDYVGVAMYYNKDVFKKAGITATPKTWSQMMTDLAKIKAIGDVPMEWDVAGGYNGEMRNLGWLPRIFYSNFFASQFNQLRYTKQSQISQEDYVIAIKKGVIGTPNPRWKAMWPIIQTLAKYWQPNVEANDNNGVAPFQAFLTGNVGIWLDGSYSAPTIIQQNPSFQWGTFKIPLLTKQTSKYATNTFYPGLGGPFGGGFNYSVSTPRADSSMTPAKMKAVINWLQFLSTPAHDSMMVNEQAGFVPTVIGANPLPDMKGLYRQTQAPTNFIDGGMDLTQNEEDAIYRAYQSWIGGQMSLASFEAACEQQMVAAADQLIAQNHWNLSQWGIR